MNRLSKIFGIDLRSLALFRICLGLIILVDIISRLPDIGIFYTDAGLLSREAVFQYFKNPWVISVHFAGGTAFFQSLLFFLQFVFAVGLLFGFKTRLMAVLSWFLMISLHRRNHLVCGAGDDYFRLLLFWGMFLPLGARWSIDNFLNAGREKNPSRALSVATLAILIQIAGGYLLSASYKWDKSVWQDGTAIYYALNIENYATGFAQIILQYPDLMNFLTHATLWLEIAGPFLLFCPFFIGPVRTLFTFAFISLHAGFYLSMYLMLFPVAGIAGMTVFLPSWFWDRPMASIKSKCSPFLDFVATLRKKPRWAELEAKIKGIILRLPSDPVKVKAHILTNVLAAFFLSCVIMWNLSAIKFKNFRLPKIMNAACNLTHLNQAWRMFAPPAPIGGWFVVPGKLNNGTEVDLFRDGIPVNWNKPDKNDQYKNERWRRYMFSYVFGKNRVLWNDYGKYLCRSWNAGRQDQQQLNSLEIVFMSRRTPPPGETAQYNKKVLLNHKCFGSRQGSPAANNPPQIKTAAGVRRHVKAGKFYAADPAQLTRSVDSLVGNAEKAALSGEPVALIVPHAAYKYSGSVAAQGFKHVNADWDTIVLLGPSHRVPITEAAIWPKGAFTTPLGSIEIDEKLAQEIMASSPLIKILTKAHVNEHSLEVQLPFLQRKLGQFKIVPILISTTDLNINRLVGEAIARSIEGKKALVVISSDLSHYPDQETARIVDQKTLNTLAQLNPEYTKSVMSQLGKEGHAALRTLACGQGAILTGMYAAKNLGANTARIIKYINSGDTKIGNPDRVVGYGAVAFLKENGDEDNGNARGSSLTDDVKSYLLAQASQAIEQSLEGAPMSTVTDHDDPIMSKPTALFVTLEKNGRLRGCMGTTSAVQPLSQGIHTYARRAAFNDPRFPPLTKEEFKEVDIKVSILSAPWVIDSAEAIVPGKHGVIVQKDNHKGIFLPSVWKKIPDKEKFLNQLCSQKAKLAEECWKDPETELSVFISTDFK